MLQIHCRHRQMLLFHVFPQCWTYSLPSALHYIYSGPANGAGLNGLEFLRIDDFSAVEALAGQAAQNGTATAWGVALSADFFTQMRDSDPDAALREAALPTLLTYSGNERILSDATQAQTIAAVQSLPAGRVVLEPFTAGDHNYLAKDPATAAALDEALRKVTVAFLAGQLG